MVVRWSSRRREFDTITGTAVRSFCFHLPASSPASRAVTGLSPAPHGGKWPVRLPSNPPRCCEAAEILPGGVIFLAGPLQVK